MTKIHRLSHINNRPSSTSPTGSDNSPTDNLLSTRTQKSISKSRRSSLSDIGNDKPSTATSSRRASLVAAAAINITKIVGSQTCSPNNILLETDDDITNIYQSYKTKMKRSSRKLDSFFGEITPIDVCISEIRKEGVKAMLESKVPLCYFLHFLLSEYSSENLFFYLEVEQYETMQFLTIAEQKALAQQIFDQYVSDDADFEINLEDKVKRAIGKRMKIISCSPFLKEDAAHSHNNNQRATLNALFSDAKASIYILLESSFTRFLQSRNYKDMLTYCGDYTIHYSESVIRKSIQYMVNYLKEQKITFKEQQHVQQCEINKRYIHIIEDATKRFIKLFFGPEYLTKIVFNKLQ